MSDAAYTARPTNKAMALERLTKLASALAKDESGQYKHDDAVKYTELVKRELGGMFNMLDKQHGMSKLTEKAPNKINRIKSTDAYDASDILLDRANAKQRTKAKASTSWSHPTSPHVLMPRRRQIEKTSTISRSSELKRE